MRASLQISITEVSRKTQRSETDEGEASELRKVLKIFERGVDGKEKLASFWGWIIHQGKLYQDQENDNRR